MKKLIALMLLALPLGLMLGCGGDDDGPSGPTEPTDQEVLAAGWSAFEGAQWSTAEAEFRKLIDRGALVAEAHDGLGWTFARSDEPDSARVHFEAALEAGSPLLEIADQTYAGLAFANDALGNHTDCRDAATEVTAGWVFGHDSTVDHVDVTLILAVAHYALGDFADSLTAVQQIDSGFNADVATAAGRADLAAMIELLLG